VKRKIINIDREKCNGCGECIPDCPEGAIQMIDGKAVLVSDLFCDGLGACLGGCPVGAITVVEREAEPYNEKKVMENIVQHGPNTIKAHLSHLKEHGENILLNEALTYLKKKKLPVPSFKEKEAHQGCPGSAIKDLHRKPSGQTAENLPANTSASELSQWPIQLHLANPRAPYFQDSDILLAADCVPFAYPDFHNRFLKGRKVLIMCPKLDQGMDQYVEKLTDLFSSNNIKSISVVHMQVPCCSGIRSVAEKALAQSGKKIPMKDYTISLQGEIL
jgi:NAD-dependent dihydropyrimidine dehydrogenase PreA subunit